MSEPAVLQATFADWRTVKGRKQLQLIFEVPIEQQAHVLSVLGAPLGDSATWVVIARLQAPTAPPERAPEPPNYVQVNPGEFARGNGGGRNPDAADRAREAYKADTKEGQAARKAGIMRSKDPEYQEWLAKLADRHHAPEVPGYLALIAETQRLLLRVDSCSEIATDPLAYERWKQHLLAFEQATGRAARPS